MKKLLALAMLLVLCAVLTGLLTGCKDSAANTMMVDDTPKVAVTSPDVPVISTKWTERQYTVSEQDETVLLTARYQIPVLTLTGSPDNSDTAAKNRQAAVQHINDWFTDWRDQQVDMLDEMEPGTTSYDYWARMLMTDSYSRFHSFHEISASQKIMGFLNLTPKLG